MELNRCLLMFLAGTHQHQTAILCFAGVMLCSQADGSGGDSSPKTSHAKTKCVSDTVEAKVASRFFLR